MARSQPTPWPELTDGELAAYATLVERYGRQVYNIAYRLTGRDADAKDLAQEAFIRVFRAFRRIDPEAHLDSWLYRIVTNLYIDSLRRRPKVRLESLDEPLTTLKGGEVSKEVTDSAPGPEAAVLDAQLDSEVQQALLGLNPELRMIVVLSDVEGYSYEEIGAMLAIPVGTVKSRLHRARKTLQSKLAGVLERRQRSAQ
ncbi:MAG TPA: sigma-70 family RNA polymerase sigma factor [bacterium]|nr:sigma-70 family RNA polymerase sigma factor [bacterium]